MFDQNSPLILIPFIGGAIFITLGGILANKDNLVVRFLGILLLTTGGTGFYMALRTQYPDSGFLSILPMILICIIIFVSLAHGSKGNESQNVKDKETLKEI